jgi:hypothetical protein
MIITKSIAEKYAKRLIESYQAKLPIRNILLEITKRYNRVFCEAKNYTPEQADAFVKQEEPKFYQALRRNQNALITSPKIGGNYGPYIKGIVNLILQFIANNLPENPDDFTHVGTFNLGKELNTEVEKEKSTVANPNPATAPSAVAESYNRPISFKNYLINDEINEQVKQSILRKVFNENNLPDELLNEIIGSLYRGIFGSKPKRIAATHDQKITATFGNAEAIKEKLNDIFNSLIKGLMAGKGNLQKFGKPMSMIMPQIIQGLENEFNKSKSDPLQYMKTIIPEKSFVKSTDTKKSFIGSLFGYQSQAEQAALAIAKQKHNKFIAFMEMLNIDPNSLGQMTLIEFKNKIKENINRLQNNRKQAFYSFMDEYKKQIDNVFKVIKPDEKKETSNKIKEITTQSDNEKVTTVLGKLGGSFKTYGLGMLAALIFSMVMTGVSHHGMNADAEGKGFKPTAGQLDKKVGGDGGYGPTTSSSDFMGDLNKSLQNLDKHISSADTPDTENALQLSGLLNTIKDVAGSNPDGLDQFLSQNPDLNDFLQTIFGSNGGQLGDPDDLEYSLNNLKDRSFNAGDIVQQLKGLGYGGEEQSGSGGEQYGGGNVKSVGLKHAGNVGKSSGQILAGKGPLAKAGAKLLPGTDYKKVQQAEKGGESFETYQKPKTGLFGKIFGKRR